jgi:hypothetical protein
MLNLENNSFLPNSYPYDDISQKIKLFTTKIFVNILVLSSVLHRIRFIYSYEYKCITFNKYSVLECCFHCNTRMLVYQFSRRQWCHLIGTIHFRRVLFKLPSSDNLAKSATIRARFIHGGWWVLFRGLPGDSFYLGVSGNGLLVFSLFRTRPVVLHWFSLCQFSTRTIEKVSSAEVKLCRHFFPPKWYRSRGFLVYSDAILLPIDAEKLYATAVSVSMVYEYMSILGTNTYLLTF